jgi:tetrahydromethanopterin S-methyltransferase subunit G
MSEQSLFDAIAALLPVDQRELFYRRMAHLRKLNPDDEVLQVCEAMGFLALITREAPERMAKERVEIERVLGQSVRAFQESQKLSGEFLRRIEGQIEEMPSSIAKGLDSASIALRIAVDLRQRFAACGMPDVANDLRGTAATLEESVKAFSTVGKALGDSQSGILGKVNEALTELENRLETTMAQLDAQLGRLRWNMLKGVGILCGGCVVVGVVLGLLLARSQ